MKTLIKILCLSVLWFSCDLNIDYSGLDPSAGNEENDLINTIRGYVFDLNGNPISNSYIFIGYNFSPISRPSTTISVSVPNDGIINIWVEDNCGNFINYIVQNEFYESGYYNFDWNATNSDGLILLDGNYIVKIEISDEIISTNIFLALHPGSEVTENEYLYTYSGACFDENNQLICEHIAKTGSDGFFEFDQDCLSLDVELTAVDEDGNPLGYIIVDKMRLFTDNGYNFGQSDFFVPDTLYGAETNIFLNQ